MSGEISERILGRMSEEMPGGFSEGIHGRLSVRYLGEISEEILGMITAGLLQVISYIITGRILKGTAAGDFFKEILKGFVKELLNIEEPHGKFQKKSKVKFK